MEVSDKILYCVVREQLDEPEFHEFEPNLADERRAERRLEELFGEPANFYTTASGWALRGRYVQAWIEVLAERRSKQTCVVSEQLRLEIRAALPRLDVGTLHDMCRVMNRPKPPAVKRKRGLFWWLRLPW